jgi:hypothetical protein
VRTLRRETTSIATRGALGRGKKLEERVIRGSMTSGELFGGR